MYSALADRFIRLIGVPPMHLACWRMQMLLRRCASLAQVAEIVGYDSRPFSRAFKKGVRRGASHVATFEQLGHVEANL
jgi:transcriptional regulator GlxA family with amidase domain